MLERGSVLLSIAGIVCSHSDGGGEDRRTFMMTIICILKLNSCMELKLMAFVLDLKTCSLHTKSKGPMLFLKVISHKK